eukprot:scaffold65828_cov42-Prasinocladus_malaysianus.AAC.1
MRHHQQGADSHKGGEQFSGKFEWMKTFWSLDAVIEADEYISQCSRNRQARQQRSADVSVKEVDGSFPKVAASIQYDNMHKF